VNAALKLTGFLALLALIFGVATVAGEAIGPDREGAPADRTQGSGPHDARQPADREAPAHGPATPGGHEDSPGAAAPDGGQAAGHDDRAGAAVPDGGQAAGHDDRAGAAVPDGGQAAGHGADDAAAAVRGLAASDGGLTLALARDEVGRGDATTLRFTIRDEDGEEVRDFDVAHARRMHLILVRRDGRGFQHLHPRLVDGEWRVRVLVPQAGSYRVFADFERAGRAYTLATDLAVDGSANYRALPARSRVTRTDGYRVELEPGSDVRFTITRGGRTITPQRYLGARGHLVALREGDLAFVHVHPTGDVYEAELEPGTRYRLYLQFRHGGEVHTAEFTR
jgi:hypothetical protein